MADPVITCGVEVWMHFTLRLEDGMVAETTQGSEPLHFVVGDGTLVNGLESVLYGLKMGDKQHCHLTSSEAFGERDPGNIFQMDRSEFDEDTVLEPGLIMAFSTPNGEEIPGAMVHLSESTVTVDFNHPLAGHDLTFEVEIIALRTQR
jgi:FKBP-type peptidyl-prolyl cis-trans isomerase SlpA